MKGVHLNDAICQDARWAAEWAPLASLVMSGTTATDGVNIQGGEWGGAVSVESSLFMDLPWFTQPLLEQAHWIAPHDHCVVTLSGDQPQRLALSLASTRYLSIVNDSSAPVGVALVGDLHQPVAISVLHRSKAPVVVSSALRLGAGGSLSAHGVLTQSVCGVMEWAIQLAAPQVSVSLQGLHLGVDASSLWTRSFLRHDVPDTTATQLLKSVGHGKSYSEYDGTVWVSHGAHGTDSTQRNPNLLLTPSARAISKPQLRIYADDVTCGHGATVSQVSDEEWWYLRSRGLSRAEAYALLIEAFIHDMVPEWVHPQHQLAIQSVMGSYLSRVNPGGVSCQR